MGFIFGGNTGETSDSADSKRKLALAMLQKGMDTSPVQSWTQGAARVAEAVMGGMDLHKQDVDQKDADAQSMALITGSPYTPPPQSGGFLSSLFGANKVPASDAQGQVAAASPAVSTGGDTASAPMSGNQQDFVNAILPAAIEEGKRTGVDPRIIVAQGALESGWGKHAPGNNYFGIKSHGQPGGNTLATTEYGADGQPHGETASFRAYQSPADSVKGYGDFILQNPRYEPLRNAQGLDAQLQALGASGYASSPKYASSVGAIARGLQIPNQVASLDPSAGMGQQSPQQAAYVDPQVTTDGQAPNPAAQAIQQQAPLPGPGGQMPPQDPTQTASVGPMQPPQAAPPMAAPVNVPNQPISNPQPADLSGVGMGGAAPGPGQFPPAPANPQAQLASAMQGAPQQAQANPQQQLAQAMQSAPVAPNPMRDNPRVQQLMRAMSNPNASPQMRAMVGAALQQEMARGEDAYKLQLDAYQRQQDPAYQVGLQKGELELKNLQHPESVVPESMRVLNARATAAGFQPGTSEYKQFMASGGQVQRNEAPPPAGYQNVRDPEGNLLRIEPIPGSAAATAVQTKIDANDISTNVITQAAQHARDAVNAPGMLPAIGSGSAMASNFANSNAAEVRKDVGVLRANASLNNLSAMRAASPTGGALGSVTEGEEKLLSDKVGALDPDSPHFLRDLDSAEKVQLQIIHGKEAGTRIWEDGNPKRYPNAPKIGTVDQAHKYVGGNPAEPDSWEPVK